MKCQKHLFNLRKGIRYLNCAYKAPLLKSAEKACINALMRERNPVDIEPDDFFSDTKLVREYFANIINANSSSIAIVPSVSYGLGTILKNITAKENGKAITLLDEFPSCYYALKKWCTDNTNELVTISPNDTEPIGAGWNNNVLDQINESTSIVLMSSVHWMNGVKFNIEEIGKKCKKVGAKFIVDGTQSVGAMPMDVKKCNIDALVCASYKWLFGPYSLALVYLSDNYSNGIPLEETWMNRINATDFSDLTKYEEQYKPNSGRYNVGETSNFILMPILKESLKQILIWKPNEIQSYCEKLITPLKDFLITLNITLENEEYFCNHLFSLPLSGDIEIEQLKSELQRKNICLSFRGNYLRVSVNVFNDSEDIEKLIEVITQTLKIKSE